MTDLRVVVIGGGIAGLSAAYHLAVHPGTSAQVVVLEAEPTLAFHSTGRSAAQLIENYGAPAVRPLTSSSLAFFRFPPPELVDGPLLHPRPVLTVGRAEQDDVIRRTLAEGQASNADIGEIPAAEAVRLVPALRRDLVARALLERGSADIDVAGLHQAFVRGFRRAGGTIATGTEVEALTAEGRGWSVHHRRGRERCDVVVNAAGAWGDVVARMAGVEPVGLQPLRRTVFTTRSPHPGSPSWPLVVDVEHRWYVKPDGVQLLCSPADETPSDPCDARAREVDVALGIERINAATTLAIRSITASWAGLRTFAPDRSMVIGPEPSSPSFAWLVGQGGTGIQTAPGAGRLVADLVIDGRPGPAFTGDRLDLGALTPHRLR